MGVVIKMLPTRAVARRAKTLFNKQFSTSPISGGDTNNHPPNANDLPLPAGIASFMRLPVHHGTDGLDAAFVGVPIDTATSNRPGTRFGPRQIRTESVMIRPRNQGTGEMPLSRLQVADIGDVRANLYNVAAAADEITAQYKQIVANGCVPLTMGGDHFIAYPILRAIHSKYGKVGLIHVDAHPDTRDGMMGERIAHGTPFRCAWEDGILDNDRVVQIGLRGTGWHHGDIGWGRDQGWTVVEGYDCWHKEMGPVMEEVRKQMGDGPVYLSFDIDAIDPGFCPGTGTPEVAGLTTIQALEIVRGCRGLNLVGCDLVEVSPPYDTSGTTALTGANLLFEMLCVLPHKNK